MSITKDLQVADNKSLFFNPSNFEMMLKAAKLFSGSTLVPKEFQRNESNCVIAINMAHRLGADPLLVMQNIYIVHGKPAWAAKFLIACFNSSGKYEHIQYEWKDKKVKTLGVVEQ